MIETLARIQKDIARVRKNTGDLLTKAKELDDSVGFLVESFDTLAAEMRALSERVASLEDLRSRVEQLERNQRPPRVL